MFVSFTYPTSTEHKGTEAVTIEPSFTRGEFCHQSVPTALFGRSKAGQLFQEPQQTLDFFEQVSSEFSPKIGYFV